ncbi:MAG TPA: condensation domain-containing protein, partial [Myxococcaceae bacterium]|nr:condensation domain-containing protein [Myxococcaceae bacterium]
VRLQALPLNPNGKLDRNALPDPDAGAFGSRVFEPPQGALEETLAALWCELLGLDRVGRQDHFFSLGGHSLLAVQLLSRIRSRLGLEAALAELFANPHLAEFARVLTSAANTPLPAIMPAGRTAPLPLSFAQQRLWFLDQLDARANAAYLIPGGLRLSGPLDTTALQRALDCILARHEALRTGFVSTEDAPVQRISPPEIGFALTQFDLSASPDPEAEARRHAEEETSTAFDLARGPLIRGRLLTLAPHDHVLLITMHHIVSDGWSMGVLVREFRTLYAAFSQGQDDPLPPLSIQYADFALWQRQWFSGEILQRQLQFWRTHLLGAPPLLELPTDRPRPPMQDFAGQHLGFELDEPLSTALKALSQRHGCTLFMTLLAAWGALLARLCGQSEVVIGSPIANRNRAEIEPLIGFFVNAHALRLDFSAQPSVAALLAQVRATALAAQEHPDLPFEQLIESLNPPRSLAHPPLFQVLVAWQNAPEAELSLPGLHLSGFSAAQARVKFDLELSMHEVPGHSGSRLAGTLSYATAL